LNHNKSRNTRSAIRKHLLNGASGFAFSVASMVVALGICTPGDAWAQTTVNPVQTTIFMLSAAQNPITFGPQTNIDPSATAGSTAVFGNNSTACNVTNQGTLKGDLSGVTLFGIGSSLTNSGTISQTGSNAGAADNAIFLGNGGTVTNNGTI